MGESVAHTEVKKILKHYFSEQLGEGAADDIAREIKDRVAEVIGSKITSIILRTEERYED
ncbi:hypothetical protein LCGC14_1676200 [marine sediment metagenome]|uniref:Uncharacterized protein n=1 Tax=marine sediment metagenome TaxID=412755 RepID=A0A0F9ICC7_9ZZZZ